jgi:DNA-binding transcriptional LysR family regulator
LLERSTRSLRLTELGAEIFEYAMRSAELSDAIENLVSNRLAEVAGTLRISAPPNVTETLLTPLICAFQQKYPNVRVQTLITDRHVDHIAEGIELAIRLGPLKDSSLVANRMLTYRHQLVASPTYLSSHNPPKEPNDLHDHRLISFLYWNAQNTWTLVHKNGKDRQTVTFEPYLSMNDFHGLASVLVAGGGIGELPPVVQPALIREGRRIGALARMIFHSCISGAVTFQSRVACSKNSRDKWPQLCFPACQLEELCERECEAASPPVICREQVLSNVAHPHSILENGCSPLAYN